MVNQHLKHSHGDGMMSLSSPGNKIIHISRHFSSSVSVLVRLRSNISCSLLIPSTGLVFSLDWHTSGAFKCVVSNACVL